MMVWESPPSARTWEMWGDFAVLCTVGLGKQGRGGREFQAESRAHLHVTLTWSKIGEKDLDLGANKEEESR